MTHPENTTDSVTALRALMDDLVQHGWPTESTWAAACVAVGRTPPEALDGGKPVSIFEAACAPPRQFDQRKNYGIRP